MFTLEDLDLAEDLAFIRENGARYLPQDIAQDGRRPGHLVQGSTRDAGEEQPEPLVLR